MKIKIVSIVICTTLLGCASNSGVVPMGNNIYMISRQAATGFSGMGTLKAEAMKRSLSTVLGVREKWC